MSVEAPSMGAVGSSIGSSIGASIGPSVMEGPAISSSIGRQSLSSIMSMPELRVSASSFSMDTSVPLGGNAAITQIKRPEGMDAPRTAVPQVFYDAWSEPATLTIPESPTISQPANQAAVKTEAIRITIPDLTTKPLEINTQRAVVNPTQVAESFPAITLRPEPAAEADAEPQAVENTEVAPSALYQPEAEIQHTEAIRISPFVEPNTQAEPDPQSMGIAAQEANADEKLAQALIAQIEANPNLDPKLQIQFIQDVEQIVIARTQTQDIFEPQEVTQAATQTQFDDEITAVKRETTIIEPWWDTYKVDIKEVVDKENETVGVESDVKYTGKIPHRDLEPEAEYLAQRGATSIVFDRRVNGWREEDAKEYIDNLKHMVQKTA